MKRELGTRYDITIGQVSLDAAIELVRPYATEATFRVGLGLWEGKQEPSVTTTIIMLAGHAPDINAIARDACARFGQECVLVERWACNPLDGPPYCAYLTDGRHA